MGTCMTYQQFLEKLRQTPRTWHLVSGKYSKYGEGKCIRNEAGWCPMQEVFREDRWNELTLEETQIIARSADKIEWSDYYSKSIRHDLLEACGLEEA